MLPRSRLRPRTFRIGVGQSVLLGGVARVDVTSCPHATMYVTVWASSDVSLWMGKTENAEDRYDALVLLAGVHTLLLGT